MIAVRKSSIYEISVQRAAWALLLTLMLIFQGLCLCKTTCDGVEDHGNVVTTTDGDCRYAGDLEHSHQHSETCGVALDQTKPTPSARVVSSLKSTMLPSAFYYGEIYLSDITPAFSAAGNIVCHQKIFLLTQIMRC